jgi:hypothetical protein
MAHFVLLYFHSRRVDGVGVFFAILTVAGQQWESNPHWREFKGLSENPNN